MHSCALVAVDSSACCHANAPTGKTRMCFPPPPYSRPLQTHAHTSTYCRVHPFPLCFLSNCSFLCVLNWHLFVLVVRLQVVARPRVSAAPCDGRASCSVCWVVRAPCLPSLPTACCPSPPLRARPGPRTSPSAPPPRPARPWVRFGCFFCHPGLGCGWMGCCVVLCVCVSVSACVCEWV